MRERGPRRSGRAPDNRRTNRRVRQLTPWHLDVVGILPLGVLSRKVGHLYRWLASESRVAPMVVVVLEPTFMNSGALSILRCRSGRWPIVGEGVVEAFHLAVGPGVGESEYFGARCAKSRREFVAQVVLGLVGEVGLNGDPMDCEQRLGPLEEARPELDIKDIKLRRWRRVSKGSPFTSASPVGPTVLAQFRAAYRLWWEANVSQTLPPVGCRCWLGRTLLRSS